MRVYHLTSAEYALSNIALKRLKISRLHDLNDPFELQAINLGNKPEFRRNIQGWKSKLGEKNGLLCFSKSWQNPVLWSHYASRHKGICLGFDLADGLANDVKYAPGRLIQNAIKDDRHFEVDDALARDLLYTKYEHWKYEEETRVFVQLDASTMEHGNYFYKFSDQLALRQVILGPLCEIPIHEIRDLTHGLYEHPVFVSKSRLAYKFFKVVEDEQRRSKAKGA